MLILHRISSVRKQNISVPRVNNSVSRSSNSHWNPLFSVHNLPTLLFIPSLSRKRPVVVLCALWRTLHDAVSVSLYKVRTLVTSLVAPACYVHIHINRQFPLFRLTRKCSDWHVNAMREVQGSCCYLIRPWYQCETCLHCIWYMPGVSLGPEAYNTDRAFVVFSAYS